MISAMTSRPVPAGREIASPSGPTSTCATEAVAPSRSPARSGSEHSTCTSKEDPASRSAIGPLADDLAPVDDGHRVTGPLDLVEEMGREHDGATLGHEGQDHVAHVLHPGRVEAVHGLVEDEQLGVTEEAGGHAEALAHAHRVLRHLVVGPMEDADPLEGRPDPARLAAGSRAAARICRFWRPVRWPWKRGSSTMAPTRASARPGGGGRRGRAAAWCRRRHG